MRSNPSFKEGWTHPSGAFHVPSLSFSLRSRVPPSPTLPASLHFYRVVCSQRRIPPCAALRLVGLLNVL